VPIYCFAIIFTICENALINDDDGLRAKAFRAREGMGNAPIAKDHGDGAVSADGADGLVPNEAMVVMIKCADHFEDLAGRLRRAHGPDGVPRSRDVEVGMALEVSHGLEGALWVAIGKVFVQDDVQSPVSGLPEGHDHEPGVRASESFPDRDGGLLCKRDGDAPVIIIRLHELTNGIGHIGWSEPKIAAATQRDWHGKRCELLWDVYICNFAGYVRWIR